MPEPPTWPPPPDVPHPLAAHEEFLSACVRNSTPKLPLSRLRLIMSLRQETHRDLRGCRAAVYNFCDRHAIFMPVRGIGPWIAPILSFVNLAIILILFFVENGLRQRQHSALTHLTMIALRDEREHLHLVGGGILLVNIVLMCAATAYRNKKAKADAAEAAAKFAEP